jgi:hypothetical protein
MIQDQLLRVGVIALGLLSVSHGIAFADTSPDFSIPEPGTLTLVASGIAALGGINLLRRRKK